MCDKKLDVALVETLNFLQLSQHVSVLIRGFENLDSGVEMKSAVLSRCSNFSWTPNKKITI